MSTLTPINVAAISTRSTFFSMTQRHGSLIVRFTGPRLGEAQATVICPDIKDAILQMGGSFKRLVLDLSEVRVMSSYGLGLCIELRNFARLHHADATLFGWCNDIRDLFRLMNVDRLFSVAYTEEQLSSMIAGRA